LSAIPEPKPNAEPQVADRASRGREKKTLLIVSGDNESRLAFEGALARNFVTFWTSSISQSLRALQNGPYDGILLELGMPNVDGYELLALFHSHPLTVGTPVICMTSEDPVKVREKVSVLGGSVVLRHPLDFARLGDDLRGIFFHLNQSLVSRDGHRVFTIAFNEREKYQAIHRCIQKHRDDPETLLLLSWIPPEKILDDEERKLIETGKLVFLEIKPSLIVKFPYLQDISPILMEIETLLDRKGGENVHLIFDELVNLLNLEDGERALSKAYLLTRLFERSFSRFLLLNTRSQRGDRNLFLQKLGKIFIQNMTE